MEHGVKPQPQLTKREYFAARIMQGLCAQPETAEDRATEWCIHAREVADAAIDYADALIAALKNTNTTQEVEK